MKNKIIIGITGKSGAGKTTVSNIFKSYGFAHINTDKTLTELYKKNTLCFNEITDAFSDYDILDEAGEISRIKLADVVFNDEERLELLNEISHKHIIEKIRSITNSGGGRYKGFAVDGAALIESGFDNECDYIITVTASENELKRRIIKRDMISEDKAVQRLKAQKDDDFYTKEADFVINNNGDMRSLYKIVENVIFQLEGAILG